MRKLVYLSAVIIAAAFVGCSKSDDDSDTVKSICHFDDFRKANGNPTVTYSTMEDGRRCRQIEYDCLFDTIQSHGPATIGGTPLIKLLTNFKYEEIISFETFSETVSEQLTNCTLTFDSGDKLYFDYGAEVNREYGELKIIRTKFQCIHN